MTKPWTRPDDSREEQCAAALRALDEFIQARLELDLKGAQIFTAVARLQIPRQQGAANLAELVERRGLSFSSAKEIENLALAQFFDPGVEEEVRTRSMHVANAAMLGRVDVQEDFRYPEDQWLEWARTLKPRQFQRKFQQRREEVLQGRPVDELIVDVSAEILADFRRARCLASRSARKVLSKGQTLGIVLDEYLDEHDPLRTEAGTRRVPDSATRPESRYIAAEVKRRIRMRHWDCCAVPWCRNEMFLEFSHRKSKCMTGDQEVENLDLLCSHHHFLFEVGTLRIEGTADDPVFKTVDGRVLGEEATESDLLDGVNRQWDALNEEGARLREAERAAARASGVDSGATTADVGAAGRVPASGPDPGAKPGADPPAWGVAASGADPGSVWDPTWDRTRRVSIFDFVPDPDPAEAKVARDADPTSWPGSGRTPELPP